MQPKTKWSSYYLAKYRFKKRKWEKYEAILSVAMVPLMLNEKL